MPIFPIIKTGPTFPCTTRCGDGKAQQKTASLSPPEQRPPCCPLLFRGCAVVCVTDLLCLYPEVPRPVCAHSRRQMPILNAL